VHKRLLGRTTPAPSMRMERLFMWMAVVGVIGVVLTDLADFAHLRDYLPPGWSWR
jgi:hypothetical protein